MINLSTDKCPICKGHMPAGNKFCSLVCYYIDHETELLSLKGPYKTAMEEKVKNKKESLQEKGMAFFT